MVKSLKIKNNNNSNLQAQLIFNKNVSHFSHIHLIQLIPKSKYIYIVGIYE